MFSYFFCIFKSVSEQIFITGHIDERVMYRSSPFRSREEIYNKLKSIHKALFFFFVMCSISL